MAKIFQYSIFAPFFAALLSWIRYTRRGVYNPGELGNDDESLEYIRKIILLGLNKREYESILGLSGVLANYYTKCTKVGCKCKKLLKNRHNIIAYNINLEVHSFAFDSKKRLPDSIKNSWKVKVFSVLFSALKPSQSTYVLQLALAEVQFFYLGNYYQVLTYVQNIELGHFSLIANQRATNIIYMIDAGIKCSEKENQRLEIALDFMSYYNLFIS